MKHIDAKGMEYTNHLDFKVWFSLIEMIMISNELYILFKL
jgi:hypothetical protein